MPEQIGMARKSKNVKNKALIKPCERLRVRDLGPGGVSLISYVFPRAMSARSDVRSSMVSLFSSFSTQENGMASTPR